MSTSRPKVVANKYFTSNTAKDVWSLTNEAAAKAANNSKNQGRELINLGQGFFHIPLLNSRLRRLRKP